MFSGKRFLLSVAALFVFSGSAFAQEIPRGAQIVGEVFGKPVTAKEFNHHYRSAASISRQGARSRTQEDLRKLTWENMIFLREANRLGVTVDPAEVEKELKAMLENLGIEHNSQRYSVWISSTFGEGTQAFEQRLEDILKIEQFKKAPRGDIEVTVTSEEIKQKFLNQQNSLESEYILFDTHEEAETFRKRLLKNRSLWKETYDVRRAEKQQKGASWINIMSLEALIDLWKMPKDDAYRVHGADPGDFVVAENIYGPAVFRVLNKRDADMERYDDKKQEYLRNSLVHIKKHRAATAYLEELVDKASYRDYVWERQKAREAGGRKALVENLKSKSVVVLETNQGTIELKLFPDKAPKTCQNFTGLVEKGYYDGIIFHRVIKNFMLQCGDPTGTGRGGDSLWGGSFEDEFHDSLTFDRPGLLAMANAGPGTNRSQFFITTAKTPWLNNKHTIFGEILSGMDVVRAVESVDTDASDKPREEQKIIKARLKEVGETQDK